MATNTENGFDVELIRSQFPILQQHVYGKPLVYFDNAATSQKPLAVINAIEDYYDHYNSNIHRGAHYLANFATEKYENARKTIAKHINANDCEVNFVRGTTEAVNLVATAYGKKSLKEGDEIIVSEMEHHSNIVPWQMLCIETRAVLRVIPITDTGELIYEEYLKLLTEKTKIVAVAHTSNALGTIHPIKKMIADAHNAGAVVFIDAAQALPHTKVDVKDLDCDFLGFSGHKVFAGTGIGILYGKEKLLDAMNPYMGGGEMIKTVSFKGTTYNGLPYKFEAGTPHIEGGISLGVAIDYVNEVGLDKISSYEHELLAYGTAQLSAIDRLRIIGTSPNKSSVISFLVGNIHPTDIGIRLDSSGIAIRTGHHCCQPLMDRFSIEGTCRASFAFYNTKKEIDVFVEALSKAVKVLS